LQQLDSSFTERDYGAGSFRQFVEMLQKAGMLEIKKVDSQLIVELPQAEEAAPVADSVLPAEEALQVLYKALKVIDENDLWGQLDFSAVRDYVQRLEPDFDEKRFGFGQFAELLNYAQDLGLVRLEPDADSVWRVFPGVQFTPTRSPLPSSSARPSGEPVGAGSAAAAEESSAPDEEPETGAVPPAHKPRRRTYRRHSRKRTSAHHAPHSTA
jgi:hypothetical protein